MDNLYSNLTSKGWTHDEIKKASIILDQAAKKKTNFIKFLDTVVYWFVLIIAIVGNIVLSTLLVPFLLVFRTIPAYIIVLSLGLTFGFLFNIILKDLKDLEKKEHLIAGIFIPAIALISVFYMVSFSNHLAKTIHINEITHSPIIISIIYVLAFITPYLFDKYLRKK